MRMLDQSEAFPTKVNTDEYLPIIEAASKAAKGADGLPRVVCEGYATYKLATRAANAIRKHSKDHNLNLRVSLPANTLEIKVYKEAKPYHRKPKKNDPALPQPGTEEKPAES